MADPMEAEIEARRYVRGRCSVCMAPSPVCDQREDPRRSSVAVWMEKHRREAHPIGVVWELAGPPPADYCDYCGWREHDQHLGTCPTRFVGEGGERED